MIGELNTLFYKIDKAKPFIYRVDSEYYFYSHGIFRTCTDDEIKMYSIYQKNLNKLREQINEKDENEQYYILREMASAHRKYEDFELLKVLQKIREIEYKKFRTEDVIALEDMKRLCLARGELQSLEQQVKDYDLVYKGIIPYMELWFEEGEIRNEL